VASSNALAASPSTSIARGSSPLARLSVSLHEKLSWNFGWQFYNYAEKAVADQNYNAHVGYSSLRWSF
jgi:hypothetical protein